MEHGAGVRESDKLAPCLPCHLVLGILFAFMVVKIFHLGGGIVTVAGFAVFFVGLSYLLAHLREKRQGEERLR